MLAGGTRIRAVMSKRCTVNFTLILVLVVLEIPGLRQEAHASDLVSDAGPEVRVLGAKNPRIKSIKILGPGARPRFSPAGDLLVFDRRNDDGFYDVYISDLAGSIVNSLTSGKKGINQRHNGNAQFDRSGRFIVFVSEEARHPTKFIKSLGDPGIGLYSNFWATNRQGSEFWKLTNVPANHKPVIATVNPEFSPDGSTLVWTERYDKKRKDNWGEWRLKAADYVNSRGKPSLRNERVLVTPRKGNYITAMGFVGPRKLLVAANLDGQHEYGMDQYIYDLKSGHATNLTRTPETWEEGSAIAPNGQIVYMSNLESRYKLNFSRQDWSRQPLERDYYLSDVKGQSERLTFFNVPSAPEYLGYRIIVAACDFSHDGRYLAGTIGIDHGKGKKRKNVELKVILIEFKEPLKLGTSH